MGIRDILFGKKQVPPFSAAIYSLSVSLHPLRLPARRPDYVKLDLTVRNAFDRPLLTSVVLRVPKELGFDQSAISHEREIRLGELAGGESKNMRVLLYGTSRTGPGTYKVEVFALSHYRDYSYVLNEVRKTVELRAA